MTDCSEIEGIRLDLDNIEFMQALDLAMNTNESFFLTGKAGTGKTTFLKCLRQVTEKEMVVLALTGVAQS